MTAVVLEVGPVAVRCHPAGRADGGAQRNQPNKNVIATALAGVDDTTVLLDERPVAVSALWRSIIAAVVPEPCPALTVVHPTWWPRHRVARIVDAAAAVAAEVVARSRSAVIGAGSAAAVVEITDDIVVISGGARPPAALCRPIDAHEVARMVGVRDGVEALPVLIESVLPADELAVQVRDMLQCNGIPATVVDIVDVLAPAPSDAPSVSTVPSRSWAPLVAAAAVVVAMSAVGFAESRRGGDARIPVVDTVGLVEGRVALRIPSDWEVTRITAGPGSRRVQIRSPADAFAALQLTQSYAPGDGLDTTAGVLRRAVDEQPAGVFVDFNGSDRRGGRPAVTYREVRPGREIRWSVILDGATRISIGCQSAPGRESSVAQACEQAISTAHEALGTA